MLKSGMMKKRISAMIPGNSSRYGVCHRLALVPDSSVSAIARPRLLLRRGGEGPAELLVLGGRQDAELVELRVLGRVDVDARLGVGAHVVDGALDRRHIVDRLVERAGDLRLVDVVHERGRRVRV